MKKFIVLLLTILLFSGCSVDYNLEINDMYFRENIDIGKFDASKIDDFQYLTPYAIVNNSEQKFYLFDYSDQVLNLSYDFDSSNFGMSEAFNQCYEISNFSYDDNNYYIMTSGEFKCLSYLGYTADEVKINIKSDYKVVSSNADYFDDNIHTWVINRDNKNNKPIDIVFDKNVNINKGKFNIFSQFGTAIMASIVLLVVGFIILIIYLFGKRKNKI